MGGKKQATACTRLDSFSTGSLDGSLAPSFAATPFGALARVPGTPLLVNIGTTLPAMIAITINMTPLFNAEHGSLLVAILYLWYKFQASGPAGDAASFSYFDFLQIQLTAREQFFLFLAIAYLLAIPRAFVDWWRMRPGAKPRDGKRSAN